MVGRNEQFFLNISQMIKEKQCQFFFGKSVHLNMMKQNIFQVCDTCGIFFSKKLKH